MRSLLLTTALAMTALLGLPAHAMPTIDPTIDDPQLWVGPTGTTGPLGGSAIGGESNLVSDSGGMTFGVVGNHNLQSPLLVIFAQPTGAAISLTSPACGGACALAPDGIYGLTLGLETLSPGEDVYDVLNLAANGSESYTNYETAALAQNPALPIPTPSGAPYHLTVFEIPASITAANMINATETGASAGTFVSLFSCEIGSSSAPGAACSPNGAIGNTPFTNAGLITTTDISRLPFPAPEPASLAMFGLGLLGLAWARRARRA